MKYLIWSAIISLILLISSIPASKADVVSKGIVIITIDDLQAEWIEDIAINLIELHTSKNIPVVLGTIPHRLDESDELLKKRLKDFHSTSGVEVAQHGYSHSFELGGMNYNEQKDIINKGRKIQF